MPVMKLLSAIAVLILLVILLLIRGAVVSELSTSVTSSTSGPQFTCAVVANTAATNFTDSPQIMTAQVMVAVPGDGQITDFGSFAVAYYDASGNELGSATLVGVGYVTPGQTLQTAMDASQEAPSGASTCQVIQWS